MVGWILILALSARGDENIGDRADATVMAFMENRQIPGLAFGVVYGDGESFVRAVGLADVENHVPVTAETFFRFASVSKPMTAVAAMSLVEEGKLPLDEPLSKIWPGVSKQMGAITLRHLLAHQSGLYHHQPVAWKEPLRHYKALQDRVSEESERPLLFQPGERFSYTTFGYCVAGRVMEVCSGKPFEDLMKQRVFDPAGMMTARADNLYKVIPNRAQGYFLDINNELRNSAPFDPSGKLPGGGIGGSISDLTNFLSALQTGTLLEGSSKKRMWTKQFLNDGTATHYGLGWNIDFHGDERAVYHTGSQP